MRFTFISPDEKILGDFKPSSRVKKYLTNQKIKTTALQAFLFIIFSGSVLAIPRNIYPFYFYLPLISYISFIFILSFVPAYIYLRRISRRVYIITDKRVIFTKPKGKALYKSIPVDSIEAAIAVSNPVSQMNYYSVFIPRIHHFDMNGIDTNLPVTVKLLSRMEKRMKSWNRGNMEQDML
ncbi:hypothetical protein OXIME_000443 [Oxyplasma meridianum]|uniref:DUF304 domain-containing protein n=1 Tax=Oxyplasma meridianum TaxID=3073602 RepID=A0AAX4NFK0_9ARCH